MGTWNRVCQLALCFLCVSGPHAVHTYKFAWRSELDRTIRWSIQVARALLANVWIPCLSSPWRNTSHHRSVGSHVIIKDLSLLYRSPCTASVCFYTTTLHSTANLTRCECQCSRAVSQYVNSHAQTTELLKLRLPLTNTIAQFHGLRQRRLFLPIQHVVIRDPIAKLVTFSPVAASTLARSTQCPTKLCPLSEVDNGVLTQIRTRSYNRAWGRLLVKPVRPTRYTHTCVPVNRRTLIHTSPCLTTACLQAGVLSTNNAGLYYTTQLTVLVYSRCFVLSINC